MESTLDIKIVGHYSMNQCEPADCMVCNDAPFGSVLIDGICAECRVWITQKLMQENRQDK